MSDIDLGEGGHNKRLNQMVAVTVVALSVFLGLAKIKDDNLVQAMAQAKANAVDTWSEYQATKLKLHMSEDALVTLDLMTPNVKDAAALAKQRAEFSSDIAKYNAKAPDLQKQARAFDASYDAMNYHDDQFDMADAFVGIGIAAAAVAALAGTPWVLFVAWAFGGFGVFMGLAGFMGWMVHPDFIANFLS